MTTRDEIEKHEQAATAAKENYLERHGWRRTCNTPGSLWLWRRDFLDIDVARLQWWKVASEGKEPNRAPSKPTPYGIITTDIESALHMTRNSLDRDDEEGSAE